MSWDSLSALTRWTIIGVSIFFALLLFFLLIFFVHCLRRRAREDRSQSQYYKFEDDVADAQLAAERHDKAAKEAALRDRRMHKSSSIASTDDAIAAPRATPEDVPSSGVAFLDDYGRPIASPISRR